MNSSNGNDREGPVRFCEFSQRTESLPEIVVLRGYIRCFLRHTVRDSRYYGDAEEMLEHE